TSLSSDVVAVLRRVVITLAVQKGRDIVQGFRECVSPQQRKPVGISPFNPKLEGVIDGGSVRRDEQDVAETLDGAAFIDVSRAGRRLVEIAFHHQLCSLRANVVDFNQEILVQLALQTKAPLLRIGSTELPVHGDWAGQRFKSATGRKRIVQRQEVRRLGKEEAELKVRRIEVKGLVLDQCTTVIINSIPRAKQCPTRAGHVPAYAKPRGNVIVVGVQAGARHAFLSYRDEALRINIKDNQPVMGVDRWRVEFVA